MKKLFADKLEYVFVLIITLIALELFNITILLDVLGVAGSSIVSLLLFICLGFIVFTTIKEQKSKYKQKMIDEKELLYKQIDLLKENVEIKYDQLNKFEIEIKEEVMVNKNTIIERYDELCSKISNYQADNHKNIENIKDDFDIRASEIISNINKTIREADEKINAKIDLNNNAIFEKQSKLFDLVIRMDDEISMMKSDYEKFYNSIFEKFLSLSVMTKERIMQLENKLDDYSISLENNEKNIQTYLETLHKKQSILEDAVSNALNKIGTHEQGVKSDIKDFIKTIDAIEVKIDNLQANIENLKTDINTYIKFGNKNTSIDSDVANRQAYEKVSEKKDGGVKLYKTKKSFEYDEVYEKNDEENETKILEYYKNNKIVCGELLIAGVKTFFAHYDDAGLIDYSHSFNLEGELTNICEYYKSGQIKMRIDVGNSKGGNCDVVSEFHENGKLKNQMQDKTGRVKNRFI